MFGSGAKTIGLTLDPSGARLVKLKKKKTWEIERVSVLPLPPGLFEEDRISDYTEARSLLTDWIRKEKLQGQSVTLSFPTSHVIVRRLRIQSTSDRDLAGLVALEVETTLHLPFEDPVHDFIKLGTEAESTNVLVFAASRQLIQSYTDMVEGAGLKVSGIELSATALARAIRELQDEKFGETMLVNLDASALEIYMFHGGHPVFLKTIALYGQSDMDGVLSEGQLSELTAEIARMLNFYQFSIHEGNARITEALIVGSDQGRNQLLAVLQQSQPEVNIRAFSFDTYATQHTYSADDNRVAVGLALWHQDKQRINLMPRIDREARLYPVILAASLAVWVLAVGAVSYYYFDNKSELKAGETTISQLNDQIALLQSGLEAQNSQQSGQTNPLKVIEDIRGNRRDAVAILTELEGKLPSGSRLQSVSYSSLGQIGLTVQVSDFDSASRYLFDLKHMSFAASAQLQSVAQSPAGEGPVVVASKTAIYSLDMKKPEGGEGNDGTADAAQ
ncbi:pilus assembly protein PilM [Cohnella hashimotonis]|uniref:Pilus assembly protein PilM n=1 Tax=Cohnella hashimotonis TaxID=2826895 RepID=A0ABT6TEP8_9BACL|nr:pilus assembly protein PilM [Cohnella hashimotonis]MDI4644322.1 pilus assembly protein PilM [Cohnella hashimotonis]